MDMKYKIWNKWIGSGVMLAIICMVVIACKKKFEDPPILGAPGIVANTTIKDLKARFTGARDTVGIFDDVIIEGIVVGDDRSGFQFGLLN